MLVSPDVLLKSGILVGCELELLGKGACLEAIQLPHAGSHQTHLLKVHEVTYERLIPDVQEVGVFGDQRHEGDDRRSQLVLHGSQHTVVPGRVLEGTETKATNASTTLTPITKINFSTGISQ